ncbi:MAG: LysM peptidoglycan-binding domain-containing protein, partial [Planctomycetes bacterium]|nr:LysM peptidoglycan-binding domain-containing protein [Planctomycetota bacterium]
MGQLEKYGLYVLCLLIFLILGVTVMGSGAVAAPKNDAKAQRDGSASPQLAVGDPRDDGRDSGGARAAGDDRAAAKLPDIRKLLAATAAPKPAANDPSAADAAATRAGANDTAGPVGATAPANPGKGAGAPPATPPSQPVSAERPIYEIQRGDNYELIARERFGTRSLAGEIMRLNPKLDPKKLRPGHSIQLPTAAEVEAFLAKRAEKRTGVKLGGSYKIAKGDTLIGIAKRQLGSEGRLADI